MLFEKITGDEIQIIERLRHQVVNENNEFFQGNFVDTKTFLTYWEHEKQNFQEVFKDSLILKKTIKIRTQDYELEKKIQNLFSKPTFIDFKFRFLWFVETLNKQKWNFREAEPDLNLCEIFSWYIFYKEAWLNNIYEGPNFSINIPNGKTLKINHGEKIIRIFGKIVKKSGDSILENLFEQIRLWHSQILNDANIETTLCISIHPIDYMTASYNENNWKSCMNWEEGEYRRGVIEMMNSPYVIVAYTESKKEKISWSLGNQEYLKWNSKKWREFFIVRPEMICGIKGYPYWNRDLEKEILHWLMELFAPVFKVNYHNKIYNWNYIDDSREGDPIIDEERNICVRYVMQCGPAMYNDFLDYNDYCIAVADNTNGTYYVDYSGVSECICCGSSFASFDSEGELLCADCTDHIYCYKCGEELYSRDEVYEVNGRYYCYDCYMDLEECDYCGQKLDTCNDYDSLRFTVGKEEDTNTPIIQHYVARIEDNIPCSCRICRDCADKVFILGEKEFFKSHILRYDNYFYNYVIPFDRITEEGIKTLFEPEDVNKFLALTTEHN